MLRDVFGAGLVLLLVSGFPAAGQERADFGQYYGREAYGKDLRGPYYGSTGENTFFEEGSDLRRRYEQSLNAPARQSHEDGAYRQWRDRQLEAMDRDYGAWRADRIAQMDRDYDLWRQDQIRRMEQDFAHYRSRTGGDPQVTGEPGYAAQYYGPVPGYATGPADGQTANLSQEPYLGYPGLQADESNFDMRADPFGSPYGNRALTVDERSGQTQQNTWPQTSGSGQN